MSPQPDLTLVFLTATCVMLAVFAANLPTRRP